MINKILKTINSIPKDKLLHYGIAYILFDALLSVTEAINLNAWLGVLISIVILTIAIVAKEIYDKASGKGVSELGDVYAGYLGVFTKLILFAIALL